MSSSVVLVSLVALVVALAVVSQIVAGRRTAVGWDVHPAGDNPYHWPVDGLDDRLDDVRFDDAASNRRVPVTLDDVWADAA